MNRVGPHRHRKIICIWWGLQIIQLSPVLFSPEWRYFISLRPKYLPQHPVLAQPQRSTSYKLQIFSCDLCYYPNFDTADS